MDINPLNLLESLFPKVAEALQSMYNECAPTRQRILNDVVTTECAFCLEETGHDEDCAYLLCIEAWEDLC